jgi:hypothetical protein
VEAEVSRGIKKVLTGSSVFVVCGGFLAAGGCSSNSTPADGGLPDSSMMMTDTGTGSDAAMDSKKDTTPPDNQPMCPTPIMLSNFMAPTFVMPSAVQNVCSLGNNGDIQGYWDNCRAPQATMQGCATWKGAHSACAACIESKRSDGTWGPLVVGNGITFLNVSGCLQLNNEVQCAKDYQALEFCSFAACDSRCPVSDFFQPDHSQTLMDWQTCDTQATMGTCMSFATPVNTSCANDKKCTPAGLNLMSFQDGYFIYGPMFCSGGG